MPARPPDRKAHRAALLLIEAVTQRRVRAVEEILSRPDAGAVAVEAARVAVFLGLRVFPSRAAFLANVRQAVDALDAGDAQQAQPSRNGAEPGSPAAP